MRPGKGNHGWILAVSAAVLAPALILHGTCVAVMGPGTWGSGLQEALPEFKKPDAVVEKYRQEFLSAPVDPAAPSQPASQSIGPTITGTVVWSHTAGERTIYLTEEQLGTSRRQRLYTVRGGKLREAPIPAGHVVVRPKWMGRWIIYERWNPWAVSPMHKLRRYVASWVNSSLRPEAALYGSRDESEKWSFLMPGHSLAVAPDGRQAALLRSGALLAGYFSIHTWRVGEREAPVVISLREHDGRSTQSFSLEWSRDSLALRISGKTDGFERRASQRGTPGGITVDLVYLVTQGALYDLNSDG